MCITIYYRVPDVVDKSSFSLVDWDPTSSTGLVGAAV